MVRVDYLNLKLPLRAPILELVRMDYQYLTMLVWARILVAIARPGRFDEPNFTHWMLFQLCVVSPSGPRLNIKTVFPMYGDSHFKDKTVSPLKMVIPVQVGQHLSIETAPRVTISAGSA